MLFSNANQTDEQKNVMLKGKFENEFVSNNDCDIL